jgi:polyphosphate kinase
LQLTGIGRVKPLKKLIQAPFGLHKQVIARIDAEADAAARGKPARIIAKMNSLLDPEVIRALYRASQAGVEVDLIVRGICGLRAGVPGISDRIRVRSVVGRFLEHSRVWYFEHGGDPEVFASSADWMPRNFFSRVEVAFPIEDEDLRRRVVDECLMASLADNCESWLMNPDATWERQTPGDGQRLSVQAGLIDAYED